MSTEGGVDGAAVRVARARLRLPALSRRSRVRSTSCTNSTTRLTSRVLTTRSRSWRKPARRATRSIVSLRPPWPSTWPVTDAPGVVEDPVAGRRRQADRGACGGHRRGLARSTSSAPRWRRFPPPSRQRLGRAGVGPGGSAPDHPAAARPPQQHVVDHRPLLVFDIWEHAYYLQYKNVKADYVKNLWNDC